MDYRQDYYKFSHYFLPYTVFNFSKALIKGILNDKDSFIKRLKETWGSIEIDKGQVRSDPPTFNIEIRKINEIYNLITICLPEAEKNLETPYIGILFDSEYSVRYFTYEITDDINYFLCEWTREWKHENYGIYKKLDSNIFAKEIKDILIKEEP